MSTTTLHNERGMALLLTISLISILAVLTLQFNRNMRQEYLISANLKDSIFLGEIARSGITIAKQILMVDQEENNFDSLHDPWALLKGEDLTGLFSDASLQLAVFDESGKFQINALVSLKGAGKSPIGAEERARATQHELDVRNVLWRLLREDPFLVEDGKAREIIDSLIDWIDSGDGDGEEEYGAENSYYQSLTPPYPCKNGAVESLGELLLIKGMSPELLYGTKERPPLAALLTPLGTDGKININSADPALLQAITPGLTPDNSEDMVTFRRDAKNKEQLSSPQWYQYIPSFPSDIAESITRQNLVTVKSTFFTITASAQLQSRRHTVTATVQREEKGLSILRWDSE